MCAHPTVKGKLIPLTDSKPDLNGDPKQQQLMYKKMDKLAGCRSLPTSSLCQALSRTDKALKMLLRFRDQ